MFTHHKLKVYRKALECAGSAERLSSGWARKHSFVDHFCRASESIVLNIAEGARLLSGPADKVSDKVSDKGDVPDPQNVQTSGRGRQTAGNFVST